MKKIKNIISISGLILSIINVILICDIYSNVQKIKENNNIPREGSITFKKICTKDNTLPYVEFERIKY